MPLFSQSLELSRNHRILFAESQAKTEARGKYAPPQEDLESIGWKDYVSTEANRGDLF